MGRAEPASPHDRERRAGVCLHLSSLPGRWGIGDIGTGARAFIDWLQASDLSVWQFLPFGPTGYGNSPYQLLSVYAGNPLFIDLAPLAEIGLLTETELAHYPALPESCVDYPGVIAAKRAFLETAAKRFDDVDPAIAAEFERFVRDHDPLWLDDYALYATLKDHHGQMAWAGWDAPYARRDAGALADWRETAADALAVAKRIQFFFFRQWAALGEYASGRGVRLFGDLPIYLALDCAEAWSRPDLLSLDEHGVPTEVAGVPPDYFSADGQYWGNPVYRWDAHAAEGFAWWIARLGHLLGMCDLVRLDHFRGFQAYWAIPATAATTREGRWRPGPGAAFFDAVRAAFGSVPIVAEDLGVITEAVTTLRRAYAIPGMQVLQFLVDQADFDAATIPEDCVCYTGTHDNDTTVGWFESAGDRLGESPAAWQARVLSNTEGTRESIHINMISIAFSTAARIAIAPMQDFLGLGSEARMNCPGQLGRYWEWRLDAQAITSAASAEIRAMISESGRSRAS